MLRATFFMKDYINEFMLFIIKEYLNIFDLLCVGTGHSKRLFVVYLFNKSINRQLSPSDKKKRREGSSAANDHSCLT